MCVCVYVCMCMCMCVCVFFVCVCVHVQMPPSGVSHASKSSTAGSFFLPGSLLMGPRIIWPVSLFSHMEVSGNFSAKTPQIGLNASVFILSGGQARNVHDLLRWP